MDAREIVHRLVEGVTKQISRRLTQGWEAFTPSGPLVPFPALEGIRMSNPRSFAGLASEARDVRQVEIPSARR